jgi:hypothetical protein
MSFLLQPWHLMFFVFAGWANRQQQEVISYMRTENQILKEKLGKKRILLNDDQRRRLGGDSVVVSSADVPKPVAVQYAWDKNSPWANLFNKDGLPALIFRAGE